MVLKDDQGLRAMIAGALFLSIWGVRRGCSVLPGVMKTGVRDLDKRIIFVIISKIGVNA